MLHLILYSIHRTATDRRLKTEYMKVLSHTSKLLDRVVTGTFFLTVGVFRSGVPLYGAIPVPYVPVRVTRIALIARRYTYAPARCRISKWNNLAEPVFVGVGLVDFKSSANAFVLA